MFVSLLGYLQPICGHYPPSAYTGAVLPLYLKTPLRYSLRTGRGFQFADFLADFAAIPVVNALWSEQSALVMRLWAASRFRGAVFATLASLPEMLPEILPEI